MADEHQKPGSSFLSKMPSQWAAAVREGAKGKRVTEIILRRDRPILLGTMTGRVMLPQMAEAKPLEAFFYALCDWSLHACQETLCNGYLTLADGCRIGVAGEAVVQNGHLVSIHNVRSIHLRIARAVAGCADLLFDSVFADGPKGLLLAGPPGTGKTTLLRDLCARLAQEGYDVAVVDERRELNDPSLQNCDLLLGYPKAKGAEIALRVLSADFICLDELVTNEETARIRASAAGGAYPLVAAHGQSFQELLNRPTLQPLFTCGAFGAVAVLKRGARGVLAEVWKTGGDGKWHSCAASA